MPERKVVFGYGLGAWNGADVASGAESVRLAVRADGEGLDRFHVADHPYFGDKLDAYALLSFILGQTERITGMVSVTNLPCRPAPVLARTIASLSALSGGRVALGIGAGGLWDMIVKLGVPRLDGGSAVRAMAEAITLIRALSGGGGPVTFDGEFYQVSGLDPAGGPAPPVITGSGGPKSLAVTGRLADGWLPPGGSDWLSTVYREGRPRIDEAAAAAGRDPAQVVSISTSAAASPASRWPPAAAKTAAGSVARSGNGSANSPARWQSTTRTASSTAARTTPRQPRHCPAGPGRLSRRCARRSARS